MNSLSIHSRVRYRLKNYYVTDTYRCTDPRSASNGHYSTRDADGSWLQASLPTISADTGVTGFSDPLIAPRILTNDSHDLAVFIVGLLLLVGLMVLGLAGITVA